MYRLGGNLPNSISYGVCEASNTLAQYVTLVESRGGDKVGLICICDTSCIAVSVLSASASVDASVYLECSTCWLYLNSSAVRLTFEVQVER